jgi:hypothetical protein
MLFFRFPFFCGGGGNILKQMKTDIYMLSFPSALFGLLTQTHNKQSAFFVWADLRSPHLSLNLSAFQPFLNETILNFSQRSMTIFIKTEKPVYHQSQIGKPKIKSKKFLQFKIRSHFLIFWCNDI